MLAYVDNNKNVIIWNGERLPNGLAVQVNIGEIWTESELNQIGLYTVQYFVVPPGMQITGSPSYTFTGTTIVETWPVEPIPPKSSKSTGATAAIE